MNINEAIIKLFKSYLSNDKSFNIDKEALKKGIIIDSNCDKDVIDYACKLFGKDGYLLNQTFHKSFSTVVNTDYEDLILMQILHYFTTYGFDELGIYDDKYVYIPKEKLEVKEIKEDFRFVKINKISENELKDKLMLLCTSNIGLSKSTIECINILKDYIDIDKNNIDIINNREVKVIMYEKLDIVPSNNIEFIRYLIYVLIKRTLLIKDKLTIESLRKCDKEKALLLINRYIKLYGIINLAEIFNRFKVVFLALKDDNIKLNSLINKISKLSKKYHKPMIKNYLDDFLSFYTKNNNIEDILNNIDVFRAIKLKNYLECKKLNLKDHVYKIRNGKIYIKEKISNFNINLDSVINLLDKVIIDKLKNNVKNKKVYLDENIELALPQSEKQFAGNIPFGSILNMNKENLIVGIYWENVNKQKVDLDLKVISNEYSIGWNNKYKEDDKLVFTGDITTAPNGASEYIYIDKSISKCIFSVKVNNYTKYVDNVEYDIIIAKGYKEKLKENYIVDVNDILIKIPSNKIEIGNSEHSIGNIFIDENIKIIFTDLCTSNKMVSENNELENSLRNYLVKESMCKCRLRDYLKKSGAIIIDNYKEADFDFSINNLNKDLFIKILK